jgi:hypothetical protein
VWIATVLAALTVLGPQRGGKSMPLGGRNEQPSGTSAGPNGTDLSTQDSFTVPYRSIESATVREHVLSVNAQARATVAV